MKMHDVPTETELLGKTLSNGRVSARTCHILHGLFFSFDEANT